MKLLNSKIGKAIMEILLIVLVGLLVWRSIWPILPGLLKALKSGNEAVLEAYLHEVGYVEGYVCVFLLQFIQVISIMIPGLPIHIASGMVYGAVSATLLCYLGYVSANVLVFILSRRLGDVSTATLTKRYEKSWLNQKMNSWNPAFVVTLGCLMPGVPNGIIPYIAARTKITCRSFAVAVAVGSLLPIVSGCFAGHFILTGDYLYSIISIAINWLIILSLMWKREYVVEKIDEITKKRQAKYTASK